MNRDKVQKELLALGWTIFENNIDFRKQDPTLWWGYDTYVHNPSILTIKKGTNIINLLAVGDISIRTERCSFRYRGASKQSGELTYYLRTKGEWLNNNWFEVNVNNSSFDDFENVFFELNDAVNSLLERAKEIHVPDRELLNGSPPMIQV